MAQADVQDLYKRYGFLIYGRCLRILGSREEAQDALQTVFVQLISHLETIRNRELVIPWIFTAAKNHCFNVLRERRKFRDSVPGDEVATGGDTEERLGAREIIGHLVGCHSANVRDAVYYTYVEELGQDEIRKLTGQSPATIRRNLKRFRQSLPRTMRRLGLQ